MKEYGVIFSGSMVIAVLEGRKIQTRRVTKPQPPSKVPHDGTWLVSYPKWRKGDRIWMKESCYITGVGDDDGAPLNEPPVIYKADGATKSDGWPHVRSAMFMPRWASRFTGDVLRTWIERLQDISEADAKAEGAELHPWTNAHTYRESFSMRWNSKNGKKPGLSWVDNPWVLATEFRRTE